ncbi:MAG TPA: radical SAM protein [Bacillota bacterium]|nr:radical SAM protein [Bacillota bacterium]
MSGNDRQYIFHESTMSLCPDCLRPLSAKVVIRDKMVLLLKNCPEHGDMEELLEEDALYYLKRREYDKPGTASKTQTDRSQGCPFDCGLCPEHDQHTCIGLIEVTNRCGLGCPVCFADSGPGGFLDLESIGKMMDFYQDAEHGQAEILQISGGEPTEHPEILQILKMAKEKRFKYLMLNTNGIRIAEDLAFVKELKTFTNGFEVYLQFDGFDAQANQRLRGRDLSALKERAVQNLADHEVPMTLVCTVERGLNDRELGKTIAYGIDSPWVRGINFQPLGRFGRITELPRTGITLSGVLKRIEEQTHGMIRMDDFIPLPCNVERIALTYLLKTKAGFLPITRTSNVKEYISIINNTFAFKVEDLLKNAGEGLLQWDCACDCIKFLKDFQRLIPKDLRLFSPTERLHMVNEGTFRISVNAFVDPYNFDLKSMQKECVHIITPDLKRIPFSAYNLIYRRDYERYYR